MVVHCWILCPISPTYHGARILGVFPTDARSHYEFGKTITETLLNAGHHVTVIAPFKSQNSHENFTEIFSKDEGRDDNPLSQIVSSEISWYSNFFFNVFLQNTTSADCQFIMSMEEIKVNMKNGALIGCQTRYSFLNTFYSSCKNDNFGATILP